MNETGPPVAPGGTNSASTFGTFFSETASSKQVPRALFVDLEPSVIGIFVFFFYFLTEMNEWMNY